MAGCTENSKASPLVGGSELISGSIRVDVYHRIGLLVYKQDLSIRKRIIIQIKEGISSGEDMKASILALILIIFISLPAVGCSIQTSELNVISRFQPEGRTAFPQSRVKNQAVENNRFSQVFNYNDPLLTRFYAGSNEEPSDSGNQLSVPFHYQMNTYYCGPAALEMIFDYYGGDISQLEIADVARTDSLLGGTYADELRRAAHFSNLSTSLGKEMTGSITGYSQRKIGYAAFEQTDLTIENLKTIIDRGEPVLTLMWWTSLKFYGHFRVVTGYNTTHIITHDPWRLAWGGEYGGANVSMPYSTFLDLWDIYSNWGLLVKPLEVEVQIPETVIIDDTFEVNTTITYPCPSPYDSGDYPAASVNATIKLPEGLSLSQGETKQHSLGTLMAGASIQTSWSITSNETGSQNIKVTATGIIEGSVWGDETYPPYNYTDIIGGTCTSALSVIFHDLALVNISTGRTVISEGYNLQFNATVQNLGNVIETCNVTASVNGTEIGTKEPTIEGESNLLLVFVWNTTSFSKGNYTMSIVITPVIGETIIENNDAACRMWLTIAGDVDADSDVDIFDIVAIAGAYGTLEGGINYVSNCDLDGDGDVDIFDIVKAAVNYGENW